MGGVSTVWAPLHRPLKRVPLGSAGFPLNAAPSLDFLASGIQDHRLGYNSLGSSANQPGIVGWYGGGGGLTCIANYIPSQITTANIAAGAHAVNGTAMTLVSTSGSGITVLSTSAPATFWPTGTVQSTGVVIDGLPSLHAFGTAGNFTTAFYNRGTYVGRGVSITGVSGGTGGHFLVSGLDIYGYPMTQNINATSGATTTNSTKAFKCIISVTPLFSDAHNYSVGTADIFGFGILTSFFGDTLINWPATVITANTGFTAAVTTTASATTGDVRGTYALQTPSDGTSRLVIYAAPTVGSLVTNPTTGLFGVAQA